MEAKKIWILEGKKTPIAYNNFLNLSSTLMELMEMAKVHHEQHIWAKYAKRAKMKRMAQKSSPSIYVYNLK